MKKILVVMLAACLVAPVMMSAQEKKGKSPEEAFAALDKNSDKKVSKEEYLAGRPDDKKAKAEERFVAADKDKDGNLTLDEFKTIMGGKKKEG